MDSVDILGVRVARITQDQLNGVIQQCVRDGDRHVVSYVNVHALNIAKSDSAFRNLLNMSTVAYCDGEGVRMGARLLGKHLPPRIVLTYWIWDLCAVCVQNRFSVFFLSGLPETVEEAVCALRRRFPTLNIAGSHHGYFDRNGSANDEVLGIIERASPDILFVGFGMPAQEHWINRNLSRLNARVILTSGSMIEYVAGTRKVAPSWMAENGLEWLFRLVQEPGRLWKRYVIGNPLFIGRALMQLLREGRQR
jgi:N-acetylglucosaminyldiphosphoundecaprenol N-acetyl-beta-D-mannosaminyltransferase